MDVGAAGGTLNRIGRLGRRHKLLCGIVAGWLVAMALFPTTAPEGPAGTGVEAFGGRAGRGTATDATAAADQPVLEEAPSLAGAPESSTDRAVGAVAAPGTYAPPGVEPSACGGPRFPSEYARPCVPGFEGPNGGATWQGVTGTTIKIVTPKFADTPERAVYRELEQRAGLADDEVRRQVGEVFLEYFNRVFQLYGRRVELVEHQLQYHDGDREQACVDAARIAEQHRPFAVWLFGQANLASCLAERRIVSFGAAASYPESFLARHHPYLWAEFTECQRVGHTVAEYVGKRLVGRPARWAGDPAYRSRVRKFGVWIPEDDVYRPCVEIALERIRREYGVNPVAVYYAPVVDRVAQDAQRAAIQFKAAQVTSVLAATDYNGMTIFTHSATSQNWRPEWVLVGAGNETIDNLARNFDQTQVDGHMFGRSPYGPISRAVGPDSEPGRAYRAETGRQIPPGTEGGYYSMVGFFDLLQGAGPALTPENLARGAFTAPPMGTHTAVLGVLGYDTRPDGGPGADHAAQDQATEVYWDGSARASDGGRGAFRHTYGARFFGPGQWPAEEPPVYPR